jgi:hypothetical protein
MTEGVSLLCVTFLSLEGRPEFPENLWQVPLANGYQIIYDDITAKYLCLQ